MVAANFDQSLKFVLRSEGGWTNDPHDPGGATMWGIIQREYNAYRDRHDQPRQSVRNISVAERDDIYKREYWDAMSCDGLPAGLDYCTFDAAVNSGTGRATAWLKASGGNINAFCDLRLAFLKRLSTWRYFGSGWGTRVAFVRRNSVAMASSISIEDVRWIQESLNKLGFQLAVDGIDGDATTAAITTFQQQHGLLVDGICGPETTAAIKKALNPSQTTPQPGGITMNTILTTAFHWLLGNAQVQSLVRSTLHGAAIAILLRWGVSGTSAESIVSPVLDELMKYVGGAVGVAGLYYSAQTASPYITNPERITVVEPMPVSPTPQA